MLKSAEISRRALLAASSVAAVSAGLGLRSPVRAQDEPPLPEYADWKAADALIVHSENTIETERDALGSLVTPDDILYIRNNIAPPSPEILADREGWEVSVEGVAEPRGFTVADLKSLGRDTVAMVLQCSGNGRAFFDHETSGTQWRVGAAGNVIWTGVPLRAVVDACGGPAEGAQFVTGTGGETIPEGIEASDVIVERSVPIDVLDTILLAWEMNGEPISLAHGGPLRMIVPGFTGVNNVKYVKRVALTPEETQARIQAERYRLVPVGEESGPQYPSVWEMPAKSWITAPVEGGAAGPMQITGVAFGGTNPVERVEVSVDGGETWQEARFFGPDLGRYAWRTFVLPVDLSPGTYQLVSRATDAAGNQQPQAPEPNRSGYNHNGWQAHGVEITVS